MAVSASAGSLRLLVRVAGRADFGIEIEHAATVLEAKIACTVGCDLDPNEMRLVYKGKVLKDDATLDASGVDGKDALFVAKGPKPAQQAGAAPEAAKAHPAAAAEAGSRCDGGGGLRLTIKGPGGLDATLMGISSDALVEMMRWRVSELCGLRPEETHVIHKARVLNDGVTLSACNVSDGDVLRVARRVTQADAIRPAATAEAAAPAAAADDYASGPMPMAWVAGGGDGMEATQRAMLAMAGALPAQVEAAIHARARAPAPAQVGIIRDHALERLEEEVRRMQHLVRLVLRERQNPGAAARREPLGPVEEDEHGEDPELLSDIARTMAEARSRGAPVPDVDRFVDRALQRARDARALQERLRREAGDMDPDLEDAVAAAEISSAAATRAPRKLGGGPPRSMGSQ